MLWCVQGRPGLLLGQDLHADRLTGGRQQLRGFGQGTELHGFPVDRQDVVSGVESAAPTHTHPHTGQGRVCPGERAGGASYLSAMLAGFTLSMTITCLLQNMEVDRAMPRLEPVALATSTSSGPDAVATDSGATDGRVR